MFLVIRIIVLKRKKRGEGWIRLSWAGSEPNRGFLARLHVKSTMLIL